MQPNKKGRTSMEEKEEKALEIVSSKQGGVLAVKDFETVKALVDKVVESNKPFLIIDDEDKTRAKKVRAELNKKVSTIDRMRIDSVSDFVSAFEEQCKALTAPLKKLADDYGKEIKAFEDSQKLVSPVDNKPKVITATIKYYDSKTTDKLVKFCEENGCTLKVE